MLELAVRLVVSLAIVVGLLVLLTRFSARRFRGSHGSFVSVLHRQPLSRSASVAVVLVGDRVLVLGATEQSVSLLTELDLDALPEAAPAESAAECATLPNLGGAGLGGAGLGGSALGGSVLSPQTWKQAYAAATRRFAAPPARGAGTGEAT